MKTANERNVIYYGRPEDLPAQRLLRAGQWEMIYENGFLRYIAAAGKEVVRMIYFALRDHNWDTIPGQIEDENLRMDEHGFHITYRCLHRQDDIHFLWACALSGDETGLIRFDINGEALSSFDKNRAGFCLLHPANVAGQPVEVRHVDGSVTRGHFPAAISPHQPFFNIESMRWTSRDGIKAEVIFGGDVFEMEDQRNWTDASYKTYCTPLERPFPVRLAAGDVVRQSFELRLLAAPINGDEPLVYRLNAQDRLSLPLPALGVERASHGRPLGEGEQALIAGLALDHFRVETRLHDSRWRQDWATAKEEARLLNLPLEWVLFFGANPQGELADLLAELTRDAPPPLSNILILQQGAKSASVELIDAVIDSLRQRFPGVSIGAGTDAYFTELNRYRPPSAKLDYLSYSINPQVHAFDNASLTETLEAQRYTVESARVFSGGATIRISPVTLQPRFNPNATGPAPEPAPGVLPSQVDARQPSLYGAAWTLGSLKYLAEVGVAGVTYFETTGWRGLAQGDESPPAPFHARAGQVFPLYFIFRLLSDFKPARVMSMKSNRPLDFDGLFLAHEARRRLFLVNFTGDSPRVEVEGLPARGRQFALEAGIYHRLAELAVIPVSELFEDASWGDGAVVLPPFASLCLEWTEG
jgi:hypothetical protein